MGDTSFIAFNRGLISRLAFARGDVQRAQLSAREMTNWMPRKLGPMSLRAGLQYLGSTKDNAAPKFLPFVFSNDDTAAVELTAAAARVWIGDTLLTRPSVTTTIANPSFATNLSSWTTSGANVSWVTGGLMQIVSNGVTYETCSQQITVAGANIGVEHALRIDVNRGPVVLRVGTAAGLDDYIAETVLGTGIHSLDLTPTGDFHIRFQSLLVRRVRVASCDIEAAGVVEIAAPWAEADLDLVRFDQSGDIIYVASGKATDNIGYQQYKIERRSARGWSVVKYFADDGPFLPANVSPMTMTPSVLAGNGTLTASQPYFRAGHVGCLFTVDSTGQAVTVTINSASETFSNPIMVTGVGSALRDFVVNISGIATGSTVTLQRSLISETGPWELDPVSPTHTTNKVVTYLENNNNQTIWYRIGCLAGGRIAPDVIVCSLTLPNGTITGIGRVTGFTSSTVVDVEVLQDFGGTSASNDWAEGRWSDVSGWPTSVAFNEGRLGWFGRDLVAFSVSDSFESFDETIETDLAPILRTVGRGPVSRIQWGLSLLRMLIGGEANEYVIRGTRDDEPLTVTNYNPKPMGGHGSAPVQAVAIDTDGAFVQRGGTRVFGMSMSADTLEYTTDELSKLIPEIGKPGIVRMAVQRQPDTRLHCVRSDGTVACLVFDRTENVTCWLEIETPGASGFVEDVLVLPQGQGSSEDTVYYAVRRTVNGATKRYLERWAAEDECLGGTLNKQADSFVIYQGAATTSITGLDHIEGEEVVVWADGADVGHDADDANLYTVTAGAITLATAASNVVVGLPYSARWKSAKLGTIQFEDGSFAISKLIRTIGLMMMDVHAKGLKYGSDFTTMRSLPSIENGKPVGANEIRTDYDEKPFMFPGKFDNDAAVCLQAIAPRPVTVQAIVVNVEEAR